MMKMRSKTFATLALAMVLTCASGLAARAAELVMFEQAGCHWCAQWNAEIGPIYPKTAAGQLAPLRRVDIHAAIPDDLKDITVERFTPTFVLVENGTEIGRIRGYPGDEFFWFLIDDLVAQLSPAT